MTSALADRGADAPIPCSGLDRTLHLPGPWRLDDGVQLDALQAGLRMSGDGSAPAVLVLGGISADRRVLATSSEDGWWERCLGSEGADLAQRYRVLGVDYLGGLGNSRGLASQGDAIALQSVSTRDQATLLAALLEWLDLGPVPIIGASYGGMVALQLASTRPDLVSGALVLAASHRPEPMAVARRWVQKQVLALDAPDEAVVRLARALAMTTYRSPREFRQRFGGPDGARSLETYLERQGERFAARFSREAYRLLLDSIDRHALAPESVNVPLTLVGFDTDELCPPALMRELALRVPALRAWHRLQTVYGHDGFLCEASAVAGLVNRFLEDE